MMFHAALLALLLQVSPVAKATVGGVVLNASTGEPIANVRVSLARTDMPIGPFGQMLAAMSAETTISKDALATMRRQAEAQSQDGNNDSRVAAQAEMFKAVPVSDIFEVILSPSSGVAVVPSTSPPVMTDSAGRFVFIDVVPASYRLVFSGSGFAKAQYGQRSAAGSGVAFNLAPNQTKTDIVMRLSPMGAISGRIRDLSGDPAVGVPVEIVRFTFDETGRKQLQSVARALTDDHGDYRMFYLTAGRYYLTAGHPEGLGQSDNTGRGLGDPLRESAYFSPNASRRIYALTYYPGVLDASRAGVIDVPPGTDLQGADMVVEPQQSYRVRGRVLDSTAQPPQRVEITMGVQSDDLALTASSRFGRSVNYNPADGTFEIQKVSNGTYTISAFDLGPPVARPDFSQLSAEERARYFESSMGVERTNPRAVETVKVTNRDVEGLVLTLEKSGSISGRFRVESANRPEAAQFGTMRLQLKGPGTGGRVFSPGIEPEFVVVSAAAGSFRIDNVLPGEYRLVVQGLPSGFYIKDARFGDADVLNGSMVVSKSDTRALDIVLSSNVATLSGEVRDASGNLAAGIPVVLIPVGKHDRAELFRPANSDIDGRFTITSIALGEYTLTAWESLDPYAYFDPEFIAKAESIAKPIPVGETTNSTVNITAIPATAR